jgi:ABC-type multidrug transport system fused ATPase/permease subunit
VSSAAIALIVIVAAAVGGGLSWVTRRIVSLDALRHHHEVGNAIFLQLGVVFAVLLAFAFNQVWSQYNAVVEAIEQECASLQGVAMMAESLPADGTKEVKDAIASYGHAIIKQEWPEMMRNRRSGVASDRQIGIWRAVLRATHSGEGAGTLRSHMLTMLSRAHQMRETRLANAMAEVPILLWVLLITLAIAMTGTLFFFGIQYVSSQVAFTAVFVGCIAFSLLLVYSLDEPFQGAITIQPDGFERLIQALHG